MSRKTTHAVDQRVVDFLVTAYRAANPGANPDKIVDDEVAHFIRAYFDVTPLSEEAAAAFLVLANARALLLAALPAHRLDAIAGLTYGVCLKCGADNDGGACRSCARARSDYWKHRAAGLCGRCGKCPPEAGKTKCPACSALAKEKGGAGAARWRQQKRAAGLCSRCGTRPAEAGKNGCRTCLDKMVAYAAARARKQAARPTR